jgi:hypothetical protein
MTSIMGDGNREGKVMGSSILEGKRGRRRGSSTVPKADNTAKSIAVAGVAEGGGWHVEVEDVQRKLGRWAKCVVWPNR